jgi:hypothetical protein
MEESPAQDDDLPVVERRLNDSVAPGIEVDLAGDAQNTGKAPGVEQRSADEQDEPDPKPPALTSAATGLATPPIGQWTKVHWGLLLVALVLLVVAGQGQHFFRDDWAYIGGKLDALPLPDRYLLPHNEHWSLLPILAFRTLRATVGVGSYWPYLGLLLLLHLGITHVLWRLMLVTGSKPIVATPVAAVFSVLGAGAEDLVWAFQIGFVGSTLFGVGAVYLAVTGTASWRKTVVIAGLTLASLATSGVGLAYLIVVPLVLEWRRRRYAVAVFGLPLLVYITWHAEYGSSLEYPLNASATVPLMVGAFVTIGLASALTGYFGFETTSLVTYLVVGSPILAGIMVACRGLIANRTLAGRTPVAMCVGAVAFFGTAGLARGGLGLGWAATSRYVYVAIALLLPVIALVIARVTDQHLWLTRAIVPLAIAIALSNLFQLFAFAAQTRESNNASRSVLVAASDLLSGNGPIFMDQLPEPLLTPDLTATDLRSRYLDTAFAGVSPGQSDRLTASLNLQIQVASVYDTGTASSCRTTLGQGFTVPTSRKTAPRFGMSADAWVLVTLRDAGVSSAQRWIYLPKGTYVINSLRDAGDLTIDSASASLLAPC